MELICLDIETTGLDPNSCEVIEVAAIKFKDDKILDTFTSFVHYDKPIPALIEHLTGITQADTQNAPTLESLKQSILDFCQDLPIVGHNIGFDINFLQQKDVNLQNILIDTFPLSKALIDESSSYSLEVLCRHFNKKHFPSHRAEDDCLANIELLNYLISILQNLPSHIADLFTQILNNHSTPWSKIIQSYLPETTSFILHNPEYASATSAYNSTDFQHTNYLDLSTTSKQSNTTLYVLSEDQIKNLEFSTTQLPALNSEISLPLFLKAIQQSDLEFSQAILYLKIAKLLSTKTILFKEDLNLNRQDFLYASPLFHYNYNYPISNTAYHIDHFNFFKLLQYNLLPSFEQIYFHEIPFLTEQFIRATEYTIDLPQAEMNTPNLKLALEFRKLYNFSKKLTTNQKANFYNATFIDNITFNDPELQAILQNILDTTPSPDIQKFIKHLKTNFSQYLIYIKSPVIMTQDSIDPDNEIASLHFIHKQAESQLDLQKIANLTKSQNFTSYKTSTEQFQISLTTSNTYPDPNHQFYNNFLVQELLNELQNIQQAVIIAPAKAQIQHLHNKLALPLNEQGVSLLTQDLSGSKGKILDNIQNREGPIVLLCTNYFYLKHKPEFKQLNKLFITKLPMSLPNHVYFEYKKSNNSNNFMDNIVPNTANVLYQIARQAYSCSKTTPQITLFDSRLVTKNWGHSIINNLPDTVHISNF